MISIRLINIEQVFVKSLFFLTTLYCWGEILLNLLLHLLPKSLLWWLKSRRWLINWCSGSSISPVQSELHKQLIAVHCRGFNLAIVVELVIWISGLSSLLLCTTVSFWQIGLNHFRGIRWLITRVIAKKIINSEWVMRLLLLLQTHFIQE